MALRAAQGLAGLAVLGVLTACASHSPTDTGQQAPALSPNAVDAVSPARSGRLSVRVDASPNQRAQQWLLNMDLQGQREQGWMELSTPLGSLMAKAQWSHGQAWLETPRDAPRRFSDLNELTQALLGAPLPLELMFNWLAGQTPSDGLPPNTHGWIVEPESSSQLGRWQAQHPGPPRVRVQLVLEQPIGDTSAGKANTTSP